MSSIPNVTTAHALDEKALAALDKYFADTAALTVAGTSYRPEALKAALQAEIDADATLDSLRAGVKQQLTTTIAARAAARGIRQALKAYLLGTYGAAAVAMLQDFGIPVPKGGGKKTAASKADAVLKTRATRKARNTMGKKQRKAVKGAAPAPTAPASVVG